mmetsp:Transcript_34787/g.54357  ORF Transcript_34787/g.54357 Transcript_34787/m.54357 type:complete len:246 (-) Transcript_34787:214-951(-)
MVPRTVTSSSNTTRSCPSSVSPSGLLQANIFCFSVPSRISSAVHLCLASGAAAAPPRASSWDLAMWNLISSSILCNAYPESRLDFGFTLRAVNTTRRWSTNPSGRERWLSLKHSPIIRKPSASLRWNMASPSKQWLNRKVSSASSETGIRITLATASSRARLRMNTSSNETAMLSWAGSIYLHSASSLVSSIRLHHCPQRAERLIGLFRCPIAAFSSSSLTASSTVMVRTFPFSLRCFCVFDRFW